MATLTYKQSLKLLEIFQDTPSEQVQAMFASGCLTDVRDANYLGLDDDKRDEVRQLLGLKPLMPAPTSAPAPFQFKVGRTVKLGLHKTPAEYRKALKAAGFRVSNYADSMLETVTVAEEETEVDLSEPFTVADLGFTGNARYDVIKKCIVELGGALCPNEVGPAERLQYADQPKGDWHLVAMEPLAGSGGGLFVFSVGYGSGVRWLSGYCGGPGTLYGPGSRFVCVLVRK